jgi:hypothetical protein
MAQVSPCAPLRQCSALLLAAALMAMGSAAQAQQAPQVRIRQLNDFVFNTLGAAPVDTSLAGNLCVYSTATSGRYTITARGSGTNGAFTLANGSNALPYEVQWGSAANLSSGSALSPNVAFATTTTNQSNSNCNQPASLTASLIVILRASAEQSVQAGSYSGTLTLLVAPN